MDSTGSTNAEFTGEVKLTDAVCTSTPKALKPSEETPTLSKECSLTASNVLHQKASPPSSKVAPDNTSQWQKKAFEFYDQVTQQVERLLLPVDEEASVKETLRDELKEAHVASGYHNTMIQTLDTFSRNTNAVVMLLQRIKLQQPVILQPLSS